MKSWQDWITNLTTWFQENPSARRWAVIAAIVLILVTVVGKQSFWGSSNVALFDSRDLSSDEIGLMQVAFGKSGLNEYEVMGNRIEVPKNLRGDYLKSLSENNAVPQDLTAHLESSSSFDFFQTRAQQRRQQIDRKKQTIRDMVMQLRFVERAIVDYDETRGATPFDDMQRTAVVNVSPAGNRMLELSEVKAIRDTVRGAVAGLHSEEITIIDTFASRSHTGSGDLLTGNMQPHAITKMQAERKYENKIRSALTAYPGIRVNVEVAIDPVVRRIVDERSVDGDPVVVAKTVQRETIQRETSARAPAASPSFASHGFDVGANGQAQVQWQTPLERHSETTQSMTSGKFETTETAGLAVTNVNVSIGIPERCVQYFVDRNNTGTRLSIAEQEQKRKRIFEQLQEDIRNKVGPLVPGGREPQDNHREIVVTMDYEIPSESPTEASQSTSWLAENWLIPGLVLLGVLALALFRPQGLERRPDPDSGSQRTAADQTGRAGAPIDNARPATLAMIHESTARNTTGSATESEATILKPEATNPEATTQEKIRSQLDQWCRENPDAAAATIRQWLDKAG